jgi:TP901 family phage tail tape measure protein
MTRIGASQAFFNIVANFNAEKLITDARSLKTVMKSVQLDTFEAMLKPMQDFGMAIETGITLTKDLAIELGKAYIEFEKFFGSENLQATQNELISLGQIYNQSITEALAAGSRAAQVANLVGKENVTLLAKQAMILAEISDLTVEEAQKGIIKLQQQTGILYGELNQLQYESLSLKQQEILLNKQSAVALDSLNTIANRSVALEGDLVQTMTNFASQGKLAGDSFHFMAAASAVMLEAGEEAGTAGRALRMTYARLGGNINGTADKIEAMGFTLRDSNGEMKNMQDILAELDTRWHTFSGQQKQNIAQTISGNRHYVRFIKLMENYGRATELAEQGNLGLDSAADQANKALEDQANALEKAEKRVEFYQAAIGREMSGFMIGATKMRGDYLDATYEIQRAMGGLGETIGRLYETMKVTGEFVKMGIAIRSMAIGMDIFESVTRAVHEIEIANRTLHSKQETFFEVRQDMTQKQKDAMKAIQFMTQRQNHFLAQQKRAQRTISAIEVGREDSLKRRTSLEEEYNKRQALGASFSNYVINAKRLETRLGKAGNDILKKRTAQTQYLNDMGIDGSKLLMDFMNDQSATVRAKGAQMMANLEVAHNMTNTQKSQLKTNHKHNRTLHDGLQILMAANESARSIAKTDQKIAEITLDKKMLEGEFTTLLNKELDMRSDILDKQIKSGNLDELEIKDAEKKMATHEKIKKMVKDGVYKVGYGDKKNRMQGFDATVMSDIAVKIQGQYIATTKQQALLNMELYEGAHLMGKIESKQKLINDLKGDGVYTQEELRNEIKKSYDEEAHMYKHEIEPLLNQISEAKQKGADITKMEMELIKRVQSDKDFDMKEYEKFIKTSDVMKSSVDNANRAFGQMQFAASNAASLLGGLVGGTTGATISLSAMTSQLMMAGVELGKSAKAMIMTQAKAISLAVTLETKGASGFKKFIAGVNAAKGALLSLAATVAITVFFAQQRKDAEEFSKTLQDISTRTDELNHAVASLGGSQEATIFQGDGGLADLLGLDDVSLKELSSNAELVDYYLQTIKNSGLELDGEMGGTFDKAIIDLKVLSAVLNDEVITDMEEFNRINKEIKHELKGGFLTGYQFNYSEKEKDATYEFLKEMIDAGKITDEEVGERLNWGDNWTQLFTAGMAGAGTLKETMRIVVDQLKDGNQLTGEQIKQLDEMGSGKFHDRVVNLIREMNDLVVTGDESALVMKRFAQELDEAMDDAGMMADDLKNLTDELYNFSDAREELFFGGKYGNVTGSLYKQVVQQGVGVLYNKQEVIVSNVFHGFFNEQEAGERISRHVEQVLNKL